MMNPWGEAFSQLAWAKVKPWLWAAGGVAMLALLLLHRSWVADAKRAEREKVYNEVRAASQVVADSWRSRVEAAETARAVAEAKASATAANVIKETRTFYAANPSAGAVQCLTPDRVQQARKARAAILSGATGSRNGAVRMADPAKSSDG